MNKNEIKKDLYKSKNMAKFSHYSLGNLYYNVELTSGGIYQFPIAVVESANDGALNIQLSADLGSTDFGLEVKGSELNRWIAKAIDKEEFIKII